LVKVNLLTVSSEWRHKYHLKSDIYESYLRLFAGISLCIEKQFPAGKKINKYNLINRLG